MKTQAKKLPMARVMYGNSKDSEYMGTTVLQPKKYGPALDVTYALLPCSTRKQARALVRLHGMSADSVHELKSMQLYQHRDFREQRSYNEGFHAALRALGLTDL